MPSSARWPPARACSRGDHALADELVQHVLLQALRGRFDPARGTLCGWAAAVMVRYRASYLRSRLRAVGEADTHTGRTDPDDRATRDQRLDLAAPFGPPDCAAIRRWPARVRVLLLCRALLWRKAPADLWAAPLAAAGLPAGFPGPDYADRDPADRHARLAAALGMPVNTLHVTWMRRRTWLLALRFVRELVAR